MLSGSARQWPDNRGIFVVSSQDIAIVVNGEDHCSLVVNADSGGDLQRAFERACMVMSALETAITAASLTWMEDEVIGFLGSNPRNLGTALECGVNLKLNRLSNPRNADLLEQLGASL